MGAAARRGRRGRSTLADVPAWPAGAGVVAVLGALLSGLLGAVIAAAVLSAAGSQRQTGAGTLIIWTVTAAGTLWVIHRVARRTQPITAARLGLRAVRVMPTLRPLAAGAAAVAALVASWSLFVDLGSALPAPDQIAAARPGDRLLDRGQGAGAVDADAGVIAGLVGLGVLAPWTSEILLRGFVLPALSTWRGPLPAAIAVSVLGATTGAGAVAGGELLACVLALQAVLCLLYLRTGSVLPGIVLSTLVTGLALGVALGWGAPGAIAAAASCAAGGLALSAAAAHGLALLR